MSRLSNALKVPLILLAIAAAVFLPMLASGYYELSRARSPVGRTYHETAEHYVKAARLLFWRVDLYELAGHAYYHAKEYVQADAMYQKADDAHALSSDGWVAWGDVDFLNADKTRALSIWEKARKQPKVSSSLYGRLAMAYEDQGNFSAAIEAYQKFLSFHSDDASSHYRLGLLLTLSDQDQALPELLAASKLDPKLDPAVQTLRSALNLASLNNARSEQLILIGRALGLVNEWKLAARAFEESVKLDQKNAQAWAWLGEAYQHTGEEDAKPELDRAVKLDPLSANVRGLLGLYYQRQGNVRQALAEFNTAAALEPQNPAWQASIGESQSKLGDLVVALEAYQKAIALAPQDATYWRLLAIFCAQNNVHLIDIGLPAARQAEKLAPNDPQVLEAIGWLYFLLDYPKLAESKFMLALKDHPEMASLHLQLAMVYLKNGNRAGAYDQLIQARDLGNGNEISQQAESVLKQYFP